MHKIYSKKNNPLFSLYWLLLFRQKRRELVKEFEGDAQSILSKLHHYHTQSNIAQHEVVALTTYITNLTLSDNIKSRGAMHTIITDSGKYEISKKIADLLRSLFIKQYESEPYHQHQNKAEQHYGAVKRHINTLINLTGAPAHNWLLCLLYICNLLNVTSSPAFGGLTPTQPLIGQVPYISHFLHCSFWEPVYYKVDEHEPFILHGRYLQMKQTKSSPGLL